LLDREVELNVSNDDNKTPIRLALEGLVRSPAIYREIAISLLERGATMGEGEDSIFQFMAETLSQEGIVPLLDKDSLIAILNVFNEAAQAEIKESQAKRRPVLVAKRGRSGIAVPLEALEEKNPVSVILNKHLIFNPQDCLDLLKSLEEKDAFAALNLSALTPFQQAMQLISSNLELVVNLPPLHLQKIVNVLVTIGLEESAVRVKWSYGDACNGGWAKKAQHN